MEGKSIVYTEDEQGSSASESQINNQQQKIVSHMKDTSIVQSQKSSQHKKEVQKKPMVLNEAALASLATGDAKKAFTPVDIDSLNQNQVTPKSKGQLMQ